MRKLKLLLLIIPLFISTNCGIKGAMDKLGKSAESIAESIEKVTNAATSLLNKINDISRLVDSKLESGEITQGLADMVDGRLLTISEMLQSTIQNSGGYIFDRIDGSVDNAFGELDKLLDELLKGVLGNYVPSIIDQISSQMQLQISTISAALEDLVVVTAGQTVYIIDKSINGLVITFSIIILAIGLIIFAIIFLRKGRKLTGANYIGLALMVIFMGFFLVLILSSTVRGKIISGFDFAAELKVKEITPKVTGVVPQNIVPGKTRRIYIYGTHLNKLTNISVKLTQGGTSKFTFPQNTYIVNTSNRIVIGNLDKELQWKMPLFQVFRSYMSEKGIFNIISEAQMIQVNKSLNTSFFPDIKPGISVPGNLPHPVVMHAVSRNQPVSRDPVVKRKEYREIADVVQGMANRDLGAAKSGRFLQAYQSFFLAKYKIPEGDFGLFVFNDSVKVESPQFVTVSYPPPPVPDPDIFIMGMNWSGNIAPVAGQSATLDITFGFSHPEQIPADFNARLTTVPAVASLNVNVPEGKIAAAKSGNKVVVTTNPFSINNKGTYLFRASVDEENDIKESNEANNIFSKNLIVGDYVYDVTLEQFSFEPLSWTNNGDVTYTLVVDAGGYPTQKCEGVVNVAKSNTTPVPCTFNFPGMKEGQTIMLTFIPVLKIKGFFGGELTLHLGNVTWQKYLDLNPTGTNDSRQYDILREGSGYKIHGKMNLTRKKAF